MDTRAWEKLYKTREMQHFIWKESCKKTVFEEIREDCQQFAWLRIGAEPAGKSVWYYKKVARTAINTEYNRHWRHWKRQIRMKDTVVMFAEDLQEAVNGSGDYRDDDEGTGESSGDFLAPSRLQDA